MPATLFATYSQRSSYSVGDLVDRVLGDLNYRNYRLITSGDIVRWGQEAQDRIALETHWYRGSTYVTLTSGQAEYQLPSRVIAVNDCRYNQNQLFITNESQLDQAAYNWRRIGAGTPLHWYIRGGNILALFPAPASGGPLLQLFYTALPPVVSAPQDNYYIPFGFDYLIVVYCKLRASEKDARGEGQPRIPGFMAEWLQGITALKVQVQSGAESEISAAGENALYQQRSGMRPLVTIPPFTSVTSS